MASVAFGIFVLIQLTVAGFRVFQLRQLRYFTEFDESVRIDKNANEFQCEDF